MRSASQTLFAHVADRPEAELELDVATLLLGDWEREHTDVAHYTDKLDEWASWARDLATLGSAGSLQALDEVLFDKLGFRGNDGDYYDKRNNFLADVIDRGTGMPIALSVVYMEVARRMGITVHGVGFPGHFVVRYDGGDEPLIIDPFRRGKRLSWSELQALLATAVGDRIPLSWSQLQPIGKRHIVLRMLLNLAGSYSRDGDVRGCIEAFERIRILAPDRPGVDAQLERLHRRADQAN